MYRSMSTGRLFPETPELVVEAPAEFFCPLSGCLMIEPVRLCNTGQVCANLASASLRFLLRYLAKRSTTQFSRVGAHPSLRLQDFDRRSLEDWRRSGEHFSAVGPSGRSRADNLAVHERGDLRKAYALCRAPGRTDNNPSASAPVAGRAGHLLYKERCSRSGAVLGGAGCHFDPLTGQRLEGWIVLRSNDELRAAIHAWAESMQLDLELVATVTFCLLNKQAAGRARAAAAAAAAAASSAPAAGFLGAGSPSRSLLSNAFAVPEDDTWAQQVCAQAPVLSVLRCLRLGCVQATCPPSGRPQELLAS